MMVMLIIAESKAEWIAIASVTVATIIIGAYIHLARKLRDSKRENESANIKSKLEMDAMQRDFWTNFSNEIRMQERVQIGKELSDLNTRMNSLTEAHMRCESDRVAQAAELRHTNIKVEEQATQIKELKAELARLTSGAK